MKRMVPIALLVTSMVLTGCGTPLMTMTEDEENTVVNYAAHIVSKYNKAQSDGLVYVSDAALEEDVASGESLKDEDSTSQTGDLGTGDEEVPPVDTEMTGDTDAIESTLTDVLALSGVSAVFRGVETADSYTESDVMLLVPDSGKTYLIAYVTVSNETDSDIECDFLGENITYHLLVNETDELTAERTILSNDLTTYDGTISAGKSVDMVILFQEKTSLLSDADSYKILANKDGTDYSISAY